MMDNQVGFDAEIFESQIRESSDYIRNRLAADRMSGADNIKTAVVLGSGLGAFADRLYGATSIPYAEIPHFPHSTAPGHKGRLVIGAIAGGTKIICLQGRFHLYEGYSAREAARYVWVLKELGVSRLILTNASGGINPEWNVGDFMLILDHINFTGQNPLTGRNMARYGPRFPDMTYAYDPGLRETVKRAAAEQGAALREGVYAAVCGPSYETPAEIRMFRALGAGAVGMSTAMEAIAASHCGIRTCGISCITNFAAGMLDQPLTETEVTETAEKSGQAFERLIRRVIELLE